MPEALADGHTASNAPDLFRPPKLSGAGPGQYWGGGPPGKPFGCCQLFSPLLRSRAHHPQDRYSHHCSGSFGNVWARLGIVLGAQAIAKQAQTPEQNVEQKCRMQNAEWGAECRVECRMQWSAEENAEQDCIVFYCIVLYVQQ